MTIIDKYFNEIIKIMKQVVTEEKDRIEQAAAWVADTVMEDKLFYIYGTGAHSIMAAMELFIRAGNLCNASGVFPPGITDFDGHPKTETITGFSNTIFNYYRIKPGDLLIISNVNGINPMTIDAALEAKKQGIKMIGLTSVEFSKSAEPNISQRHHSNKNLYELVDLYIDAHIPVGDALLEIDKVPVKVGPGSTYPMILIANSIVIRAIEIVVERGGNPPVLKSANVAGGMDYNQQFIDKYATRIRHFG